MNPISLPVKENDLAALKRMYENEIDCQFEMREELSQYKEPKTELLKRHVAKLIVRISDSRLRASGLEVNIENMVNHKAA